MNPKQIPILFVSLLLTTHAPARAGDFLTPGFTLDAIATRVRTHNPHLAAARHRIEEARGRLDQAGKLSNPELSSEYRRTRNSGEHAFEVELSQSFPLTARLRLEKDVSQTGIEIAEAEVRDAERKLAGRARQTAVRLLAVQEEIGLRNRQAVVAEELASFIDAITKRGEGSALDAGQARLEARRLSLEIAQLTKDAAAIRGALKPLLGLGPDSALHLTGTLPAPESIGPRQSTPTLDPSNRPDYHAALLTIDAAAREIALEKARRFEDINVGLIGESAREEDQPVGLENESIFGIKVSIPLPFWNRNRGAIREKTAKHKRAGAEAGALANDIRNEGATALEEMRAHLTLLRTIDSELLPLAERQLELSDSAYRGGQSDLQPVLRARDQMIELESSRLEALRDYHLARVRYALAAGITDLNPASNSK